MGIEIERKFLVRDTSWMDGCKPVYYSQGYIPTTNNLTVRVRVCGESAFITIKSEVKGFSRSEYEYPIPVSDAKEMLGSMCSKPLIEKNRYKLKIGSLLWEIDVFEKDNKGLIVAEVELESEECRFELPPWILREVTGDIKYYNSRLVKHPYSQWTKEEKFI